MNNKLRNKVRSNYTQIPNELIRSNNLSWKAKGIFCYLAAQTDDWQFYVSEIKKNATDGKTSLQSGLKELEDQGWLHRERKHGDDGSFDGMEWTIKFPKRIRRVNHQTENPSDGKSTTNNTNSSNTNNNNTNTTSDDVDYSFWVDKWNEINDAQCRVTQKKRKHIRQRLKTWSKDELIEAMQNRANDDWMNNEGLQYKTKFSSFWCNDEKVEHWLQRDNSQQSQQQSFYKAL